MICKNCGSNIGENDVFCNVCGTKVAEDVQNNAPDQGSQPYNDADQTYTQDYSQGAADFQAQGQPFVPNNFQQNPVPPVAPKKKGGAGKIIAIAGGAVAVVAVAAIGTFAATGRLGNFIHKNFTSPESYFKYVAENSTEDAIDSFNSGYTAALETLDSSSDAAMSGNCTVKLEAGEQLKPLLGVIDPSLKNLDNASISVNASLDDSIQNMELEANINDTKIATIKASIDAENEEGYIQIPELSDSYIDISDGLEGVSDELSSSTSEYQKALSQIQDALPDAKTTSNIMNTYVNIAIDNVSDVDKSSKTIEAGNVSQKVTALKTTIDGKYVYDTCSDMLKTLKDDKDIKKIIESVDEDAYDDFKNGIEDAADSLKEDKDSYYDDSDTKINLTLYVNGKGEIAGTEISIKSNGQEAVISSVMPKSGSNFGYEMKVEMDDTELFSLTGKGTLKKDVMNGSFSVSIGDELVDQIDDYVSDGKDVVELNVKDFNVKDCKEGRLNGKFTFSSDAISQVEGYELNVNFASKDKETSAELSVSSDGSEYAKLTITAGEGKDVKTITPSGSDTVYSISSSSDLSDYLEEVDVEDFISNCIDASGIDIDESDVEDFIGNLLGSYDYDDDYSYYDDDDDYSYYDDDDDYSYDSDSDYDWTW